jgi:hypothetical protein
MAVSVFQVLLSSALVGAEYEEITIDPGRLILPDTTVAPGGDFLYVLSTAKVGIISKVFRICSENKINCSFTFNCAILRCVFQQTL